MPGFRSEMTGPGVVDLEFASDPTHQHPEVLGLGLIAGPPDVVQELALGDQPSGIADQGLDQTPLLWGQVHVDTVAGRPLLHQIHGESFRLDLAGDIGLA